MIENKVDIFVVVNAKQRSSANVLTKDCLQGNIQFRKNQEQTLNKKLHLRSTQDLP